MINYTPFNYRTGRVYDEPQILTITVQDKKTDEYGLIDITATFVDKSRNISGRVSTVLSDERALIGEAVLAEYDAGRYSPL